MSLSLRSVLISSCVFAAVAPSVVAQAGGFTPGDLYFLTAGQQQPFPDGGTGIARVDWTNGNVSVLLDMPDFSLNPDTSMVYDPFRDRIVFAGIAATSAPLGLWAIDAAGSYALIHADNNGWDSLLAPGSNGNLYFRLGTGAQFRYLDATNVEHFLMDSTGATPYAPAWMQDAYQIAYDAPSNSLIVGLVANSLSDCSGTAVNQFIVRKLPLSADGSKMIGPETCASFQLANQITGSAPVGVGRLPNGDVLFPLDGGYIDSTFVRVDPATLALSSFAVVPVPNDMVCASYSSALGAAYNVDFMTHTLQLYVAGSSGNGATFNTSVPIEPAGNTPMRWIEIPGGGCNANTVATYCTAKTTSHGCVPFISTTGTPSVSAGSGFTIRANSTEPGKTGIIYYSTTGAAALPFQGGFFCVKPVIKRAFTTLGGGTAACTGTLSLDFNTIIASGTNPALVVGAQVWGQFWFRDPPAAFGTGLSNAVTFHICP